MTKLPEFLWHGTAFAIFKMIQKNGLKCRGSESSSANKPSMLFLTSCRNIATWHAKAKASTYSIKTPILIAVPSCILRTDCIMADGFSQVMGYGNLQFDYHQDGPEKIQEAFDEVDRQNQRPWREVYSESKCLAYTKELPPEDLFVDWSIRNIPAPTGRDLIEEERRGFPLPECAPPSVPELRPILASDPLSH